jgi:hypothetical protein
MLFQDRFDGLRFRVAALPETLDGVLSDVQSVHYKTSFMPSTSAT